MHTDMKLEKKSYSDGKVTLRNCVQFLGHSFARQPSSGKGNALSFVTDYGRIKNTYAISMTKET